GDAAGTRQMRRVEADPDEMAEQRGELLPIGLGQWRLQDRSDVAAQVALVASAEQYDVDPRLMTHETVGRVDDAAGAALVDQKTERVGAARRGLGDAEPAELALLPFAQQGRRQRLERVVVGARRDAVQLIDVDVVGAEFLQ